MAKKSSADVGFLLIDGYNVLAETTQLEHTLEALTEESYGLGDGWVKHKATGVKSLEISQEGFYDDAEAGVNDALSGKTGANRIMCYGLDGNTIGQKFLTSAGQTQINYNRVISRGELHKANTSYRGAGAVEEGVVLLPHVERIADGDTEDNPVSVAAQTTNGGTAYLQVSALNLDGYDDVLIKILHSTDGQSWDELLSFTAVDEAPLAECKSAPNTVKKHLAVSWEFRVSAPNGEGPDQAIKFFVGFKRY